MSRYPLFIPDVLSEIVQYLSFRSFCRWLRSCCQTWRHQCEVVSGHWIIGSIRMTRDKYPASLLRFLSLHVHMHELWIDTALSDQEAQLWITQLQPSLCYYHVSTAPQQWERVLVSRKLCLASQPFVPTWLSALVNLHVKELILEIHSEADFLTFKMVVLEQRHMVLTRLTLHVKHANLLTLVPRMEHDIQSYVNRNLLGKSRLDDQAWLMHVKSVTLVVDHAQLISLFVPVFLCLPRLERFDIQFLYGSSLLFQAHQRVQRLVTSLPSLCSYSGPQLWHYPVTCTPKRSTSKPLQCTSIPSILRQYIGSFLSNSTELVRWIVSMKQNMQLTAPWHLKEDTILMCNPDWRFVLHTFWKKFHVKHNVLKCVIPGSHDTVLLEGDQSDLFPSISHLLNSIHPSTHVVWIDQGCQESEIHPDLFLHAPPIRYYVLHASQSWRYVSEDKSLFYALLSRSVFASQLVHMHIIDIIEPRSWQWFSRFYGNLTGLKSLRIDPLPPNVPWDKTWTSTDPILPQLQTLEITGNGPQMYLFLHHMLESLPNKESYSLKKLTLHVTGYAQDAMPWLGMKGLNDLLAQFPNLEEYSLQERHRMYTCRAKRKTYTK